MAIVQVNGNKKTMRAISNAVLAIALSEAEDSVHIDAASSLVARWAAESRVERSILLWGNVSSQLHLISPGCPRPNSALTVLKNGLKHRSSIHHTDIAVNEE